jgi:hypothetical protein
MNNTVTKWKTIVDRKVTAPISHLVSPQNLVGTSVVFIPEKLFDTILRGYIISVDDSHATLIVRVPFPIHEVPFEMGHMYSLTLVTPKIPPAPPLTHLQRLRQGFINMYRRVVHFLQPMKGKISA